MRIAVFDYRITPNNPAGGCIRHMLAGLCRDIDFTVFAVEFDNPDPTRIAFVHVPAPMRPLFLLFIVFHLLAPLYYLAHRLRRRRRFDSVQMVESNLCFGDLAYSHFCHRAFLRQHWRALHATGPRAWAHYLNHTLHAWLEPWTYRRARTIVVPSHGLGRELAAEYPYTRSKIHVVSNPIDLPAQVRPADFDRTAFRAQYHLAPDDYVLLFVALGHFERKGFPLLLQALAASPRHDLKLLVVGGQPAVIADYTKRLASLGLADRVHFAGMQRDTRPFFWSADAFALPSFYETFSLVALEAAAAGLPLIVTPLNGVEEYLVDGENGFLVEPSAPSLSAALARLLAASPEHRMSMSRKVQADVARFGISPFCQAWRAVLGVSPRPLA